MSSYFVAAEQYKKTIDSIQKTDLSHLPDEALIRLSAVLRLNILQGKNESEITIDAFALAGTSQGKGSGEV